MPPRPHPARDPVQVIQDRLCQGGKEGWEDFLEDSEIWPERQGRSGMATRDTWPTQARESQKAEEEV